jgi:GTP-binding protein EngB required for normal cell division
MTESNIAITSERSLKEVVNRIQSIQKSYGLSAIQPHLGVCSDLLGDQNTIDVGIFGRFKAGKSSLLNLLAGRSVLPVGVTPVTAVITRLRYGPREHAEIHYANGRTEGVPVESVKSFVSEAENPKNVKKVASLTVELPSLRAYHGVQFVDTPGLESVFQHNTDTALDWLPKVGLALVTVSVDPPLSKHDVALIRILRSYTPNIVILLTKADLVSEVEREEIAAFIQHELRREFSTEFRIIPFSVRPTHEHLRATFDKDLLAPLVENHDSARAEIVRFKFNSLVDQTKNYLSLALAAAERVDADRRQLKTQILNEKTSFESIRMELQALATECAGRTRPWIMKRMGELRPDVQQGVTQELKEKLPGVKTNLWNLSRAYEQRLQETMKREMREICLRDGDLFIVPLDKAQDTLSRAVQGFRDRLAGNIEQALGMRFQVEPFEINLQKPSSPDVAISNLFMFNTDLLWFVIPMSIFRSWADRHFLNRIPYETEKNLSRLASQWTEKINAAILKMQRDAERHLRDQISTVESLLSRTQSEAEGIRTTLSEVESFKCAISS